MKWPFILKTLYLAFLSSFCYFSSTALRAQDLKRIAKDIEKSIEEEMPKASIPGLQLVLFNSKGRFLERSYGHADAKKKKRITSRTLFQAGALVRPLSAYSILSFLKKREGDLQSALSKAIRKKAGGLSLKNPYPNKAARWGQLLGMTSGLPPSRLGVILKSDEKEKSRQKILEEGSLLRLKFEPGTQIQIAPQGYVYLAQVIENISGKSFPFLAQEEIEKKIRLNHTCILLEYCSQKEELSEGLLGLKSSYFPAPQVKVIFPAAASLFSRAQDYARFLLTLWREAKSEPNSPAAYLLQKHFQYNPELGGTTHGLFFSRPVWYTKEKDYKESLVYYIESSLPGYSSLAFLSSQGLGAALFINKDDLFFLRSIQRKIYHLYGIMNAEKEYPAPDFTREEREDLWASYRPLSLLPGKYRWLSFLNELQMRPRPEALELSSVFEKEVFVRLYPLRKDLFLARGLVNMDAWRLRLVRGPQGNISSMYTDLASYRPVPKLFSAQSILLVLGFLAGLPLFLLLIYVIRKGRS